jgi:DNA-binding transcriptional ArsR family regulator
VVTDKNDKAVDLVFKALSDRTRREILRELRRGPLPAGEVASKFTISGPSISRHLSVLRAAGLVSERRQANKVIYSLTAEDLHCVGAFVSSLGSEPRPPHQEQGKKKVKGADKSAAKQKRRSSAATTSVPGTDAALAGVRDGGDAVTL